MDFQTQAKGMIVLHRFNLFKRLESSVYSFAETLRRLIERIDRTVTVLESNGHVEEYDIDEENEEDVFLEGKYEIDVKHLRINDYLYDLENDRDVLQLIYEDAKTILDNDRDKKIKKLEEVIAKKVAETPYNTGNRKILIFSAFADTVNYIYKKINKKLLKAGLYTASISGSEIKVNNPDVDATFNA